MADKFKEESFDEIIRETLESLEEARPKASRTRDGKKVPGKYLTKDKAAMKGEIERVSKLKSDDPSAYGKWKADYKSRDTEDGKPHKTKKSAATIAYEKKFGKKNENLNLRETEMGNELIGEIIDELNENTDKALATKAKASGISKSILSILQWVLLRYLPRVILAITPVI